MTLQIIQGVCDGSYPATEFCTQSVHSTAATRSASGYRRLYCESWVVTKEPTAGAETGTVFPNPASGSLTLRNENGNVTLYDITGKVLGEWNSAWKRAPFPGAGCG